MIPQDPVFAGTNASQHCSNLIVQQSEPSYGGLSTTGRVTRTSASEDAGQQIQ